MACVQSISTLMGVELSTNGPEYVDGLWRTLFLSIGYSIIMLRFTTWSLYLAASWLMHGVLKILPFFCIFSCKTASCGWHCEVTWTISCLRRILFIRAWTSASSTGVCQSWFVNWTIDHDLFLFNLHCYLISIYFLVWGLIIQVVFSLRFTLLGKP